MFSAHFFLIKTTDEGSVWSKVWMRHGKYLFSPIILAHLIGVIYFWLIPEVLLCCTRRKLNTRLEVAQRGCSRWGNHCDVPLVFLVPRIFLPDTWLINCGISANISMASALAGAASAWGCSQRCPSILKLNIPVPEGEKGISSTPAALLSKAGNLLWGWG